MFQSRRFIIPTMLSSIGIIRYANRNKYYTEEEVSEHCVEKDAWVTYKNKVYNITDFINAHPGGKENILMAMGGPIDLYWNTYKQHNSKYVSEILKKYEIGELQDYKEEEFENEYLNEPIRDNTNHLIHKNEPFNAELKKSSILDSYVTPEKDWFTRNHHPVPDIDIDSYRLTINNGIFKYTKIININNSKITTTIQCAGNRRDEFNDMEKTMGLPWNGGAISTGEWTGVWLKDIVNIPTNKKYINLYDYNDNFSVSVPIDTPLFIAYKMNGKILSRDRGFPLRIIAPGLTGSKNVKWIHKIEFSNEEVNSPWQDGIAYKIFPSNIKNISDISDGLKDSLDTIDELKIQSYICDTNINRGFITLRGYALAGKDKQIMKVEIGADDTKTWKLATVYNGEGDKNIWCFWKITLLYNPKTRYYCRATDKDGNTQEQNVGEIWNIRGIANNSLCVSKMVYTKVISYPHWQQL